MKLLLDENLSRRILPLIEKNYPEASQVSLLGLEQASDKAIWKFSKNNNFIIVTKDYDFYELNLLYGSPPKIVLITAGNSTKMSIAKILNENKNKIQKMFLEDSISCIEIY